LTFYIKFHNLARIYIYFFFRRHEREEEEREKDISTRKRRRTNGVRKKEPIVAATAQEAMEKVIHEKKLSNKINYDILKEIEDADETVIKTEIETSTNDPKEETSGIIDRMLFKDNRNLTLTTGKTLKTRKSFRPNVNLATKRAVEQTISVIAASDVQKNVCQKEKESMKDLSITNEEDILFVGGMETNKRKWTTIQYQATNNNIRATTTESSISSTGMEHSNISTSQPKTDGVDSMQAGTSDSITEFPENVSCVMRKRKPRKSYVGKNSESVDVNSKNVVEVVGNSPSEKPRMIKTRYAKMRPNLKSIQKSEKSTGQDGQQSSLAVVSEVPREASTEDKGMQQKKEVTEVSSTPTSSEIETISAENVSKESLGQGTSKIYTAKTETNKAVTIRKTRSRYLKMKPNLLKRAEI
uniref:BRF1 domain-containing protein n=1 Tax=Onchocerca flexuosa TaxID=387005 RepID=A0A183H6F7_9BILA